MGNLSSKDSSSFQKIPEKYTIYVIRCELPPNQSNDDSGTFNELKEEKYYIGDGYTADWLPIDVVRTIQCVCKKEENYIVLQYMKEHGIDNVRGGSFTKLTPKLRRLIRIKLNSIQSLASSEKCQTREEHIRNNDSQ